MKIIIVSGQSGAGKSIALKTLEDKGYYTLDNFPNQLFNTLPSILAKQPKIALSLDIRNLSKSSFNELKEIVNNNIHIQLYTIFLTCANSALILRYSESRRLHPLMQHTSLTIEQAIQQEKKELLFLQEQADICIDTSSITHHELNTEISSIAYKENQQERFTIYFESFGFKYGLPTTADFIFDARFLPNPHWNLELRPHTGLEKIVQEFFIQQPIVEQYLQSIIAFLDQWLTEITQNNRAYLTIAIACTGGKHRSVYLVEQLTKHYAQNYKTHSFHHNLNHNLQPKE